MKIKEFLIGSDPELFIVDKSKDNKIISSIGLIPGVKGHAYKPAELPEGFGLQIDNILAEFNIPPTCYKEDFIAHMMVMKDYIRDYVKSKNPNYDICCKASALVDEDQLQSDEAKLFGCSPDYNAWLGEQNPRPQGDTTNLRTTGCHFHIGYEGHDRDTSMELIRILDLFLGVPSILIDEDDRRRQLYGKAGCFRFTSYGVEYRVMSGYFINSPRLIGWCFDQILAAIEFLNNGDSVDEDAADIVDAINNNNRKAAEDLIKKYKINLV